MAKHLIGFKRVPDVKNGRIVGYWEHRDYVETAERVSQPSTPPRAPDTLTRMVALQDQRRRGGAVVERGAPPARRAGPVVCAVCHHITCRCGVPRLKDTLGLVVERQAKIHR